MTTAGREHEQDISRLDDQAPSCPNQPGSCKSTVLCKGELFDGTGEIGDTGEDERPLL